jgi:hypothetical protein
MSLLKNKNVREQVGGTTKRMLAIKSFLSQDKGREDARELKRIEICESNR